MSSELNSVKQKVAKLLALGQSSNLSEANVALEKAMQLMQEWSLTLDDIEFARMDIIVKTIDLKRKNSGDIDGVFVALAKLCSVKAWYNKSRYATRKLSVMGYDTDVELFVHFLEMIKDVFERSYKAYKTTEEFKALSVFNHGKVIRTGFRTGFVNNLNAIIREKIAVAGSFKTKSGNSLVIVKGANIEEEFKKFNLKLKRNNVTSRTRYNCGFTSGYQSANNVTFNQPVNSQKQTLAIENK